MPPTILISQATWPFPHTDPRLVAALRAACDACAVSVDRCLEKEWDGARWRLRETPPALSAARTVYSWLVATLLPGVPAKAEDAAIYREDPTGGTRARHRRLRALAHYATNQRVPMRAHNDLVHFRHLCHDAERMYRAAVGATQGAQTHDA